MAKIHTVSEMLFQLREDQGAKCNEKNDKFRSLIWHSAIGQFVTAMEIITTHHLPVSPSVLDFLEEARVKEVQLFTINFNHVWISKDEDENEESVTFAMVIPTELKTKPQEVMSKFIEQETSQLLRFFYYQEFTCELCKPQPPLQAFAPPKLPDGEPAKSVAKKSK